MSRAALTPSQVEQARRAARRWRALGEVSPPMRGVVLVWKGRVYGWKDCLRDPRHERPGALAVDASGQLWQACGGNDQDGALAWAPIAAAADQRKEIA